MAGHDSDSEFDIDDVCLTEPINLRHEFKVLMRTDSAFGYHVICAELCVKHGDGAGTFHLKERYTNDELEEFLQQINVDLQLSENPLRGLIWLRKNDDDSIAWREWDPLSDEWTFNTIPPIPSECKRGDAVKSARKR